MGFKQLTDRIYYLEHQREVDRPMLALIKGEQHSLAIDAGNSEMHITMFYEALNMNGLPLPDYTVITHWHWDHTFGMKQVYGTSFAYEKTNEFLRAEQARLAEDGYAESLKAENVYLRGEYHRGQPIETAPADVVFTDKLIFDLGGVTAEAFHVEAPHSEDTVLIFIPEEKVLFLGDATSEDFLNDYYMDWDKLEALIATIKSIDCEYCVLSHAEPQKKADLLDYLESQLELRELQ